MYNSMHKEGKVMLYQIIATKDFVDVMKEIPLKYMGILCNSFVSMKKISDNSLKSGQYEFLNDLLSQIRNQEME